MAARNRDSRPKTPAEPPKLPPLEQVPGWSRSKGVEAVHNPDLALFGGWRLEDWHARRSPGEGGEKRKKAG